ncbi:thiamine pyrophosphate-dependent enzyme, partial [Rhizobium ruizarguesonis]
GFMRAVLSGDPQPVRPGGGVGSKPDFAKLAEAYGAVGLRCENPTELDARIEEMINVDRPVLLDCRVARLADAHSQ